MTHSHEHAAPAPIAGSPPAWRLFVTLGVAGAVAGLLIVTSFGLTQPTIQRNKAARLQVAVEEVLRAPARFDTLYVAGGALVSARPVGTSADREEPVYVGYDAEGRVVGYAIVAAGAGFADVVRVIFGYDPTTRGLIGFKVLENKETPGLGDKIEKDTVFVGHIARAMTPVRGVKAGKSSGDPHDVDLITGATISSRAVIRIINLALTRFGPMIDAYHPVASR
jgi:electron transport complex protein RnfG